MKPIRTYTRKRAGLQEIEDVLGLCRLCLGKAEEPVPIFTQQKTEVSALAIRIMICVGLEISNDDCLPNIICSRCLEELERYYAFRKKCESSYQKLKSHQAAIKSKIYKEEIENESIKAADTTQGQQGHIIQKLDCKETKNLYFKLQPAMVQICEETNDKEKFFKHTLVSIIKSPEPGKNKNSILDIQNNTNYEIQPKNHSLLKCNNNINENNEQCDNLTSRNEEIETAECGKQFQSNNEIFYVQEILDQAYIMDVRQTHGEVENDSNIKDTQDMKIHLFDIANNTIFRVITDEVDNGNKDSTVEINNLVTESIEPEEESNRVSDHITGIEHNKHLETIDNNVVVENNRIAEERHEGNLVINEMEMNEVTTDNPERLIMSENNQIGHSGLPEALTTLLLQLGVLTRHGESLVVMDQTRTVELETVDGDQYTLDFVEEAEDPEVQPPKTDSNMEITAAEKLKNLAQNQKFSKEFRDILDTNLVCPACGRRFPTKSGLRRHQRHVHGGLKPHQCTVCGKSFAQKEVMTRHQLVHKEVRPFQCTFCPKSFTQRAALTAHARAHVPPHSRALELHPCPRCPKVFLYPSGLSRHTMTHSGRVFSCDGCQKTFKDKSSLKRHMKTTHHGLATVPAAIQPAPAENGLVGQNMAKNELVGQNMAKNELVGQNMAIS